MKVLLVNGSPHEKGCTYTALSEAERILREEGLDTEIFHIGTKPISGCLACGSCRKTGRCVISDSVNVFLDKAKDADGFIFGSPVHYAAMGGAMTSFMDRAFYAAIGSDMFYLKPGACVVSARRAGTTAAFDQFIKYLTIREMPVISSQYWNVVHGNTPDEVRQDLEGMQIMRTLARNMAWFLRCKEAAALSGVALPEKEPRVATNFIR
ncbi:MAG: flavodoxin family protein [Bacillota bacterium]